jgi:hypothetical protein
VLTLRAAAQLLARTDSLSTARPLARALGFDDHTAVDASLRKSFGLSALVRKAELASGTGSLRLLVAELDPGDASEPAIDVRERTRRVAAAISRSAPDRLWCLLLLDTKRAPDGTVGATLCFAAVTPHRSGTRIAALRIDCRRVLDSDADTVRALAAINEPDALIRHARLGDILRRDALGHRFYRALEHTVDSLARSISPRRAVAGAHAARAPNREERRELALLCASRCLFLAFLEAKGWLDGRRDFLLHHTVRQLEAGGRLHERLLRPLFFGTLNTPKRHRAPAARGFGAVPFLNGGLFSPTPLERRFQRWTFGDDAITDLVVSVIDRYRFTAHEDSVDWSEAAVDPEMLGRAFEGLMADTERRRSGSYYTPPALVAHTVRAALTALLPETPLTARLLDGTIAGDETDDTAYDEAMKEERDRLRETIEQLRVIDPACGSGAFLVHLLETLDRLLAHTGDRRDSHTRRRDLLARCIFGVDRHPMAVWLCELRLWLSVVIECHAEHPDRVPPLPNLDHHIRVGDSLAGGTFRFAPPGARRLTRLRERYTRASGVRKQQLADTLDREERARAVSEVRRRHDALRAERRGLLTTLRARDLFGERRRVQRAERVRLDALRGNARELHTEAQRLERGGALPFRFGAMFADVAAQGGFTLIIGNPPWVRPHALPAREREWLRREFRVMRSAGWREGATRAGAGAGFSAQADLSAAFVERSVQLLAPHGVLALLVPAKLWRTLSGGGVRRLLLEHTALREVHDWSDAPAQFDAATYPSLIVATRADAMEASPASPATTAPRRSASTSSQSVRCGITRRHTVTFHRAAHSLPLQGDPDAPWILLPPSAHSAFESLRAAGLPLGNTSLGRPLLGVKCGCNAAFLVHAEEHADDGATVTSLSGPIRQGVIERTLLRPAIRGDSIAGSFTHDAGGGRVGDTTPPHDLRVLWTHGADGLPLRTLPPASARWLAQWRPRLQSRRDSRHAQPWWTLFRTDAARSELPRLVWADIARRMRCTVLPAGDPSVPLNSCYVMRLPSLDDAHALHALLSSTIANAWLGVLAEPARGGFRRFLGWTVAAMPIPHDWARTVRLLRPYGAALASASPDAPSHVSLAALDAAVLQAFQLPPLLISPLLEWYRHD